jgi:flagellar basal-body rod protein FlgG
VSVQTFDQTESQTVGNIQVANFINPAGLQAMGGNVYVQTAASGEAQVLTPSQDGAGSLIQGSLEASNVNVVESMVNMIETQRAYEVNSKAISAADGMLRFINNNL